MFTFGEAKRWLLVAGSFAAGSWAGVAHAEKAFIVEFTEMHDRVSPKPKSDIIIKRMIIASLNTNGTVAEQVKTACMTCFSASKKHRRKPHGGAFEETEEEQTQLGETTGKAHWTVVNSKTLKRVQKHGEQVDVITVRLTGSDRCDVDVKFFREEGKSVVRRHMLSTKSAGDFTIPVLQSSSCSIEDRRI